MHYQSKIISIKDEFNDYNTNNNNDKEILELGLHKDVGIYTYI